MNNWRNQPIDPVDVWYEIDQERMVQWLKHLRDLNQRLANDLSRDDVQRAIDYGRLQAYECLLGDIHNGRIFMKMMKR